MHTYSRKMKAKNLDVFDFNPETEVSEFALRIQSKLQNPNSSAIDKYTFLETAASGKSVSAETINYVPSLEIGAINMNHMATTLVEDSSTEMMGDPNYAFTVKQLPQSSPELKTDLSESEVNIAATSASQSNTKLKSAILDLLPSLHEPDEVVGMDINENGNMSERSSSSCGVAEDDGVVAGPSSDHGIDERETDSEDVTAIVLYPDHVLYRGSCYTDSLISFTSSYVELEGSEVDGDEITFKCKWGIEDILHITSHWYERVEMAMVKIHVLAKDTKHAENVECASVIDSSWYERLEAITALNITYKALWTSMLESEDTVVGHTGLSFSKYLPNFDLPFDEVVYPKGDADAVSISKRDFDLLQPDTFVNDTIIDFYIKYLKNKVKPDEKRRLHFFNSFFFRKLADPDKDPPDASKGGVAYQRVKKWTRKVNLFEKDYVFIPVNYNYHWSLIVMCHLGEVATNDDEDVNESMKVPCVLHMDSIRGSHSGLQGFVQSYLKEEWKVRQDVVSEDIASRFDNLRFISLELPQQQNSFDCGLFLLHYVELFLEQAPLHFNPFKISNSDNFLNVDWFSPAEASLKRVVIQKLICDLLENPHQESYSTSGNDQQCHLSRLTTNANNSTLVNLSLEDCNPLMHHQSFHDHQEIELPTSSSIQCVDDPNITLKLSFQSGFNCAIEENVEHDNAIMPDDSTLPCSSQDYRTREPWQAPVISDNETVKKNDETSPEISIYGCDGSIEIVNESSQLNSEIDQPRSPVPLDALSDYVHQMVDGNVDYDPTSCMDIMMPGSSFRFSDMQVSGSDNLSELESNVQIPNKKMRMTQPQKVSSLL
ncbi:hypothetical protein QVD17_07326 [Tagetes erecta]|uniref:Ubiquitin-like protease family profile domain-containing protein n=1 Tax=Tagetes erecta TaxID=13708 RepID=A0AAD8PCT9_TARER|nr:hypothetical protein QVD17_07326 [Tagetes erecta]